MAINQQYSGSEIRKSDWEDDLIETVVQTPGGFTSTPKGAKGFDLKPFMPASEDIISFPKRKTMASQEVVTIKTPSSSETEVKPHSLV